MLREVSLGCEGTCQGGCYSNGYPLGHHHRGQCRKGVCGCRKAAQHASEGYLAMFIPGGKMPVSMEAKAQAFSKPAAARCESG